MSAASQQRKAVQIVVAKTDLSMGATLSANDVALDNWYADAPPAGTFTDIKLVIGRPLLYPLSAKEPILLHDLGVEGAGIGLAGKIPEGMRAIAIRSNEIVGVAGFLYPGSKIDLLMSYTPPGNNVPVTQTVLQNVEVLTAGQTIEPDPQGKPQSVSVVTLLLSPEDSQKLQLASGQGNIQFVLRSGADLKTATLRPARLDDLIPGGRPGPPVVAAPGVKHGPPRKATPASPIYLMEVIQGTQRTVQKF
jgi:pilus assembly protein CpaB